MRCNKFFSKDIQLLKKVGRYYKKWENEKLFSMRNQLLNTC